MKSLHTYLFLFLLFVGGILRAQEDTTHHQPSPLFTSSDILAVTFKGNLKELVKDNLDERDSHKFQFTFEDGDKGEKTLELKLKIRGNFRRGLCGFPPIKLNFDRSEANETYLFKGLNKVKMVVPCELGGDKYSQYIQKEYLTYKGYNLITDSSFRVRMLEATFIDEGGKFDTFTTYTFLIEPVDELARRLGGEELEIPNIHPNQTNLRLTTMLSVYEYLIGNTDWSVPGLHNIKMVQTRDGNPPLAIPYDFDFCGMVNTSYASPSPKLDLISVRERMYRGYCQSDQMTQAVIDRFNATKEEMLKLYAEYPMLSKRNKKVSRKYLETFYKVSENPKKVRRVFVNGCRR